ncbi:40910_t:CDS:2 [Gigaspora margarita]|uniref:40910_t:CDS:1 n=1 Tax=Gigaspora margarita TaxID=4874 RepID=A0ABM8W598_GIGMA|nr:40910_t:CDS:2 [Gigaspora margarita]
MSIQEFGEGISTIIGWTYFLAWSISFYPQAILNWRRKSVEGLSLDFLWYNIYGFACYSAFNIAFLSSEEIRKEYRDRNDGKDNLVQPNDAYLNFRRKSTVGWSIHNILLDFTGGVLSILQLLLDAYLTNNWSGISGDPVKFGLGFLSIGFDLLFMSQHFILYRNRYDEAMIKKNSDMTSASHERERLLGDSDYV